MAAGYSTPQEGQAALGGNYTVWLLYPDGRWYSPKDVSGLPRERESNRHVVALKGQYRDIRRLPRTQKKPVLLTP
jgi:hypothetical protein